jgi:hypothetical protein
MVRGAQHNHGGSRRNDYSGVRGRTDMTTTSPGGDVRHFFRRAGVREFRRR